MARPGPWLLCPRSDRSGAAPESSERREEAGTGRLRPAAQAHVLRRQRRPLSPWCPQCVLIPRAIIAGGPWLRSWGTRAPGLRYSTIHCRTVQEESKDQVGGPEVG